MYPSTPPRPTTARHRNALPATGTLVRCPDVDCGQPAEVVDAWWWRSTDGPSGHVRTRCLTRHVFTWPSGLLTPAEL